MSIKITGGGSFGNGRDGVRIEGYDTVEITNFLTGRNGRDGIAIYPQSEWMEQHGLPPETNPKALADLLEILCPMPAEKREALIETEGWLPKLGGITSNFISKISELVQIYDSSALDAVIKTLRGEA